MEPTLTDMIELTQDDDPVVRGRAAEALGAAGGPQAIEALARLLEDPDVMVRFKASRELAWLGDSRGIPALVWALRRTELCFMALEALCALGPSTALPDVRRFFRRWHLHPLERLQAAATLHRMGDADGSRFLEEKLNSPRPEERGFALELWGRLNMPGALDLLRAVLADPDSPYHLDAVRGLARLGDSRSLPTLDRLSKRSDDPELAEVAAQAAEEIRSRTGTD